jgi:hypothetical protein
MAERRPLTVLLSQALTAFTIELDNEWEQRVPTKTTDFGGRGVWATSLRQWSNFMQSRRCPSRPESRSSCCAPRSGSCRNAGSSSASGRRARLTDLGAAAREDLWAISATVEREAEWSERARPLLERLLTDDAPLWPRIDPPPASWRSKVPRPRVLPWHPIPRQGGHPDDV